MRSEKFCSSVLEQIMRLSTSRTITVFTRLRGVSAFLCLLNFFQCVFSWYIFAPGSEPGIANWTSRRHDFPLDYAWTPFWLWNLCIVQVLSCRRFSAVTGSHRDCPVLVHNTVKVVLNFFLCLHVFFSLFFRPFLVTSDRLCFSAKVVVASRGFKKQKSSRRIFSSTRRTIVPR